MKLSAINHFIKKGVRQAEVDEYLSRELSQAGYGGVEIAKTPLGERIIIHASKPGVVIGRRGKTIRTLTSDLIAKYGFDDPKIDVKEVENPELNSKVMAYSLVSAIERGVHRRRAAYSVLRRVLNAGAKGCEIIISGKLTSKRSRHEAYRMGLVAKSGEIGSKYVQTANAIAVMKLGIIGITVNIMRGDLALPDEINVLSVNLDKEDEEVKIIEEEVEEKKEITPEKAKPAEEKAPKEKVDKKLKEDIEEPLAKKTDLDLKVEELSDLIEKTPDVKKIKPKPKAKPADDKAKEDKKPTAKETPKEVKTTEKPKAKPTKKEETKTPAKKPATKKETPAKKSTTSKSSTTKKSTTSKSTTTKKKEPKKEAESKSKSSSKSKTTAAKKETKKK
ncbi:MAG: 30S ribosomal protein S3 [Asgard group archaeon]|nr:30S ribosomal protein S3 [Asgard group archaeon]